MGKKGWLSKKDFEMLDSLFERLGYGGYYDFLECLKYIGNKLGAFRVKGGYIDSDDIKTISDMENLLQVWSEAIFQWSQNYEKTLGRNWEDEVLNHHKSLSKSPD